MLRGVWKEKTSKKMPPKNSGKFVINKKYNEGWPFSLSMVTCYPPILMMIEHTFYFQGEVAVSTQESTRGKTGEMTMKANKTSGGLSLFVSFFVFVFVRQWKSTEHKVDTNSLRKARFIKNFSGSRSAEKMTWLTPNMDSTVSLWGKRQRTLSTCMLARWV